MHSKPFFALQRKIISKKTKRDRQNGSTDRKRERAKPFKIERCSAIMIDEKLLEILACPKCKGDITLEGDKLICKTCNLAYPIKDDIPVMLIEEAENLE